LAPGPDPSIAGVRFVVTAGGTREPIDPVRYIGNRSSGKMGNALAAAAIRKGATVTLVTAAPPPPVQSGLDIVQVETAEQMYVAVRDALIGARVLVMAAAVADWRPRDVAAQKLKKGAGTMTVELVPTIDILRALRDDDSVRGVLRVGFAAETEDAVDHALEKLVAKGLDLIVVNDVSQEGIGMGADDNEVTVLDRDGGEQTLTRAPKSEIAARLIDIIVAKLAHTPA
jgi:phosphopantothenoylcysteine decarboxylase/phosphopantothenate--cysteine ligase